MTDLFMRKVIPAGLSKRDVVDDILYLMSDIGTHYKISESFNHASLVCSYWIGKNGVRGWSVQCMKTLDALHNWLIREYGIAYRYALRDREEIISPLATLAAREALINSVQ